MNKADLINALAAKNAISKKDAEKAVNGVLDLIAEALKNGEKVQIMGFGSFEVKARAARTGKNPATGETIKIAASKAVVFKAGKALKDSVQ
ncbi:MAG: HU family DNA-binding protein [Clostridiales bacterium]|nr:HU family DNA-binding protein [Clostridiales bacterium]